MALNEIRTFKDIQDAIIRRAKLADNTTIRNDLKEKINTYYQHVSFKRAYRWSGETKPLVLRKRVTAGTVAVTNGSDEVTGTGTAWAENDHRFLRMKIGAEPNPFKIIRVASTTALTLDAPWVGDTASGLSYSIYQDEYPLFPDLMNVRKFMIPGLNLLRHITPASPEDLDKNRFERPFRTGPPELYTVWGHGVYTEKTWATFNIGEDYWEDSLDSRPKNRSLIVWPSVLTEDQIAQIRYTKIVEPMGADADEPLVPYENRIILVYGPLVEHFLQNRDLATRREWERHEKLILSNMESDVETTDAELILTLDRRANRRFRQALFSDDEFIID